MMRIKHNEKEIVLLNLESKQRKLAFVFDTWGNAENNDRLLKNFLRLSGLFGVIWYFNAKSLFLLPMFIIAILLNGLSDLRYFQNKPKRFEFASWR